MPKSTPPPAGRAAQRGRTRRAIVTATMRLLQQDSTPTIDEIAAAAEVSRRTVYLHFPTLDQLLLDAAVGLVSENEMGAELDPGGHGDDVRARVAALARAMADDLATLPWGRQIIALTVAAPPVDGPVKRGYRRLAWIERAVEPLRPRLDDEQHRRLVSALAVALGWDAQVVLRDICGLDDDRARTVTTWLADVIINAAIDESSPTATDEHRAGPS